MTAPKPSRFTAEERASLQRQNAALSGALLPRSAGAKLPDLPLSLVVAAAAKADADAAFRAAVVQAHHAGHSDRAIARACGTTHPAIARIIAAAEAG